MRYIIFDADNTLYNVDTKEAYHRMFLFISEHERKPYRWVKKRFYDLLHNIRKSSNPKEREREYLISLAFPNTPSLDAVSIFWENIQIKPARNIFFFLNAMIAKNIKGIVVSEEFKRNLVFKLYQVFGRMWKEYFCCIVSADDVNVMKPSLSYYEYLEQVYDVKMSDVIMAVGDDYKKDLFIPQNYYRVKVAIYNKIDRRADIIFRDYRALWRRLSVSTINYK